MFDTLRMFYRLTPSFLCLFCIVLDLLIFIGQIKKCLNFCIPIHFLWVPIFGQEGQIKSFYFFLQTLNC